MKDRDMHRVMSHAPDGEGCFEVPQRAAFASLPPDRWKASRAVLSPDVADGIERTFECDDGRWFKAVADTKRHTMHLSTASERR